MLLPQDINDVTLSNVGATGEFKIRNSAKAFSILSSGLYSNKIRAIIRELSCNAVDSHVGAGKADVPFEVHLPTAFEPWFSVRDFGMGLDNNQVVNIYTTYFESTKTQSNDFIGALGLGSKSPFSYTENFTVTAIKNGYKRIYSAYINTEGVPSIAEMSEEITDEGNGVEVKFSVTNRNDYYSFRNEASQVFRWFKLLPVITGSDLEIDPVNFKEKDIVPGIHSLQPYHGSVAIMGNIVYPLNNIPEPEKHFGSLSKLLKCDLAIEFAIGELDFAASREQLSYIPLTIASIKSKLEKLNANLLIHLTAKVDKIDNNWKKATFLSEESRNPLYSAAVVKYVADTKFELYDPKEYYGKKVFSYSVASLTGRKLSISGFNVHSGYLTRHTAYREYINGTTVEHVRIPVEDNVVLVLNDLKTGCMTRARYHYGRHSGFNSRANVFCIEHTDPDITVRQAEYDKLIKELHNPPTIIKASELAKIVREPAKKVETAGIAYMRVKSGYNAGSADSYMWDQVSVSTVFDPAETFYYTALDNRQAIGNDGNPVNIHKIRALMDNSGVDEIKAITIYGVRKSRIKEITGLSNWVHINEALTEAIGKVSQDDINSLIAADVLDGYRNTIYTSSTIANKVKKLYPDSEYVKFVEETKKIKRKEGKVDDLISLCKVFNPKFVADSADGHLASRKKQIQKKYPLLGPLNSDQHSYTEDIAKYIALIDSKDKE